MNITKKIPPKDSPKDIPKGAAQNTLTSELTLDSRAEKDLYSQTSREERDAAEAMVQLARAGDEDAFGMLVTTYERFVYHTALRVLRMCGGNVQDGEDVAQNAFLKAFRGDCAFSTWLYRITVNCARDHCRSQFRHPTVSLTTTDEEGEEVEIDVPVSEGDTVPEDVLVREETVRQVRHAIESLPPEMRAVILLRDMEELSYSAIADLLHLEVGTVKSRLNRARNALKELLLPK